MESPQKKPATFGTTFGSNGGGNNAGTGSFGFGQSTQQSTGGTFTFGAASNRAATNGGNFFGQASQTDHSAPANPFGQNPQSTAPANPFGQPSQPANVFGGFGQQASSTPQTGGPAFNFGQTSSSSSASTNPPAFNFGQSTSVPQSPPTFNLGQGVDSQSQAPKFMFGQANPGLGNQTASPGFVSHSAPMESGSDPFVSGDTPMEFKGPTTKSPFTFGQAQSQNTPVHNNPFATLGASKPEEAKASTPLFGTSSNQLQPASENQQSISPPKEPTASMSEASPSSAANPFGGLFASANTTAQAASAPKPAFSFGTTATPQSASSTELSEEKPSAPAFKFGVPHEPSTPPAEIPEPKSAKPAFSFGNAIQSSPQISSHAPGSSAMENKLPSASLFGAKPTEPENVASSQGPSLSAPASENTLDETIQTKNTKAATANSGLNLPSSTKPVSSGGLFSPEKTPAHVASTPGFSFGNPRNSSAFPPQTRSDERERSANTVTDQTSSTTSTFGTPSRPQSEQAQPTPKPMATPSVFTTTPHQVSQPGTAKPAFPSNAVVPASTAPEPLKHPVYTNAPSRTPGHIDGEQFREYDRDYRLHSLNVGLQKTLTSIDARSHDFDNLIRHYVAARDSIGASLGLYVRSVAGSKRKGDNVDDRDEEPTRNKRTRSEDVHGSSTFGSQTKPTPFATGFPMSPRISDAPNGPATDSMPSKTVQEGIPEPAPSSVPALFSGATASAPSSTAFGRSSSDSKVMANPFAHLQGGNQPLNEATPSSTTPTKSPPKMPAFEVPKFGTGNTNFMGAFGQKAKANADKFEKDLREKRKAEDFDSDEDDEEAFEKKAEEELRAKKAKIEAVSQAGFTPNFGSNLASTKSGFSFGSASGLSKTSTLSSPGSNPSLSKTKMFSGQSTAETSGDQSLASSSDKDGDEHSGSEYNDDDGSGEDDDGEEGEDDLPEDEVLDAEEDDDDDEDDENDLQAAMDKAKQNTNTGKSLFDRIERNPNKETATSTNGEKQVSDEHTNPTAQPAQNSSFGSSMWGSQFGKSTADTPSFSPITPGSDASKASYKPATTFNFTATPPSTSLTPTPGASIFAGGLTKAGPVPGEGLFGSRPSTPSNAEKTPGGLARSVLTSPPGTDNTWKEGAPISFANGDKLLNAPTFKFTAPSPGENGSETPRPFGNLFGTAAAGSKESETPNQLGFQFGAPVSSPAPGYLGAMSHLGGGSAASSTASSRATSPGLTDNESVATNDTDDTTNDPQTSLMDSRAGEENESCLWEGRSKALMYVNQEAAQGTKMTPNDWNSMGVGLMRLLKDKTTGRTRVVFRVEPSASILINSHLVEGVTYENVPSTKSGAVKGALFYKGSLNRWVFKLKTPEMGEELAKIMEDNKAA